jgi:RimJ/RimL family protein N-acetyltransferase
MSLYEPYDFTKKMFSDNGLIIRAAKKEDFKEMCEMKLLIYKELDEKLWYWYMSNQGVLISEFYGPRHQDWKRRVFYVVENEDKKIVGSGGLIQYSPVEEPDIAELIGIVLKEEHRGKGLGRALIYDLIEKAVDLNFYSIYLITRTAFKASIELYEGFSFEKTANTKYPECKDSIAMLLFL